MKRWRSGKRIYAVLWAVLALAVGAAGLFGRAAPEEALPVDRELSSVVQSSVPEKEEQEGPAMKREKELAGVWIPYMALGTEAGTKKAFEENYKRQADAAKKAGCSALFVHVRPFCDALYPSKRFPWSHVLTGEQGKIWESGYDPLRFMVEYAHGQGMEFHAWINPLRVRTAATKIELSSDNLYEELKEEHPYYFMEWEGGVYLDPAYPYIRTFIAEGAAEIAEKYPVDGIHFDDYFYPAQDESLDSEAYELYVRSVETPVSLAEWRMGNISAMVQEVYQRVKAARPEAVFGISPQGNIANDEDMGADVKTWCAVPGYVDYLCPQLYYSFGNEALGYREALEQWTALPRREGLRLYAGLALYKAGSDADGGTWEASDGILREQIGLAREKGWDGVVLYSSEYLEAEQTRREMENVTAVLAPAGDSLD